MKQLITIYGLSLSLVILSACSTSSDVSPSQNSALNDVSNSNSNNGKGSLQGLLDNFLENDWTPTVENDPEIQKKYMKKEESEKENKYFNLQEYADKRAAYVRAHPSDHNNSHVHKINTMPIIGNSKKR